MKMIARLIALILLLGGWALATLCIHVVRVPDPVDPAKTKLVVIPKDRLGIWETYVDARGWTKADLVAHQAVVRRMLRAGKAGLLGYTVDAKGRDEAEAKIKDVLGDDQSDSGKSGRSSAGSIGGSISSNGNFHIDIDY